MLEITSAGKIIFQKLAIQSGILVPAFIDCECHKTEKIVYNNGKYICKKCGKPVEILISGNSPRSLSARKYSLKVDELQPITEKYIENERAKYSSIIDGLTKDNRRLQERCDSLEKQVFEDSERFDTSLDQMRCQYETVIKDITESNKHLQRLSNNLNAEMEQWKKNYKDIVQKYKVLKEENESLEHTKDYYKNQADNLGSISLSTVTNYVLDYITTLFNAAKDKENPEALRDIIFGRTEYLGMMLESAGINISSHERDSIIGNERVDIEVKTTDNPELDCKVIKSEHFGCTFKNDIYPMIPEKVMVYRYVDPNPKVEEISEEPAVEDEDAKSETVGEVHGEIEIIQIDPTVQSETVSEITEGETASEEIESDESERKTKMSETEVVSEV